MTNGAGQGGQDFEALARQYWGAWGEAMRGGVGSDAGQLGAKAWHDALDWWTQRVHGGRAEVDGAVERLNAQARNWYGQMQQVAAQFAGQDANAGEVARAWKQALGAVGENPFPELFRSLRGHGQQGLQQWIEDASPYLHAWKREGASWLGMPAFGFAREQQERWQALTQAQLELQDNTSAYHALLAKAGQRAFEVFEEKLGERTEPGRQLTSARALFDLWIDAAEEAYAEIALSPEFRSVYGELVNAQMRLRAGVQREVEQASSLFGMPTRSEIDSAHRKIVELERQLRRLRDREAEATAPSSAFGTFSRKREKGEAVKPAVKKAAIKKPAAKQPPPKKAAAKESAAKPATRKR